MKKCSKCMITQDLNNFCKKSINKDGINSQCKCCTKLYSKTPQARILQKRYREKNKDYRQSYEQTYRKTEKARSNRQIKSKTVEYKEYQKLYRSSLKYKEQQRIKRKFNIEFKLKSRLRTRLSNALRRQQKSGSAIKDLGCSVLELKSYLESLFQDGMTWDNHGEWHIDHIVPLSTFNLINREQLLKACHYTNLQPLWAEDNLKKSDKFFEVLS